MKRTNEFWTVEYESANGARVQTQLFVPSVAAVREEVASRGGVLLHARPYRPGLMGRELFGLDFKLAFLRGMTMHLDAGASPGQALSLMVQTVSSPRIRAQLTGALDVLQKGSSFTEGLRALGLFDDAVIGMLAAGELSGDLKSSIAAAQAYVAERGTWMKAWKPFLGWLGFEIFTALSGLWGMYAEFIPQLRESLPMTQDAAQLENYKAALDFSEKVCLIGFWGSSFVLLVIFMLFMAYRHGSAKVHHRVEGWLLKVPGMRSLLLDASLSLTFGLLAYMLKARLKFSDAMPLVIRHASVPSVKSFWTQTLHRISLGSSLSRAFDHRFVDAHERIVLAAHQDSEQLAFALQLIAQKRSEDAQAGRKRALLVYGLITGVYSVGVALLAVWLIRLQGQGLDMTTTTGVLGF